MKKLALALLLIPFVFSCIQKAQNITEKNLQISRIDSIVVPVLPNDTAEYSHLQGMCIGDDRMYWAFNTKLFSTDLQGNVIKIVAADNHHGDPCFVDGKLYVAVEKGGFNPESDSIDSWIYEYDTDLNLLRKQKIETLYGVGGIGTDGEHFIVIGNLPDSETENLIYEMDKDFNLIKERRLGGGHTHVGLQTINFAYGKWWIGAYDHPHPTKVMIYDADFNFLGRYPFTCGIGFAPIGNDRFIVAKHLVNGSNPREVTIIEAPLAQADAEKGFVFLD